MGYQDDFIEYLRNFKIRLSIRSMVEGEIVFNNEPLMQIEGPLADCQLVETAILNIINYQTLIATKAARIRSVVGDDPLLEFGSRRARKWMPPFGERAQLTLAALMQPATCGQVRFLGFQQAEPMPMH